MRKISLIGAASGWGAGLRATEDGPIALRDRPERLEVSRTFSHLFKVS